MSTDFSSFVSAVRAVLGDAADSGDMKDIGRKAVKLLDEDLVFEAAATHLSRLARAEWNRQIRENGGPADVSDEVVNLKGSDVFLGDTDAGDRAWLADNSERLADGLRRRADQLRLMEDGSGLGITPRVVTTREVLAAERRADQLKHLADAMAQMTEGLGSGRSKIEQHVHDGLERLQVREANAVRLSDRLTKAARSILADPFYGRDANLLRRAAERVAETFEMEMPR